MAQSETTGTTGTAGTPRPGTLAPAGNPYLAAAAAWLLPGAGHLYLGQRWRGIVFSILVLVSLVIGCSLDGNLYRVVANQPLSYLATFGSMGMGLPYFVLRYLVGYQGEVVAPGYEYGTAFILTAGLMNLLLVLDAWDLARGENGAAAPEGTAT